MKIPRQKITCDYLTSLFNPVMSREFIVIYLGNTRAAVKQSMQGRENSVQGDVTFMQLHFIVSFLYTVNMDILVYQRMGKCI